MAILYGTTGDGTTLPVLVDQFGNLLAKGIEGPEGPPGPPGIGQLPDDPFEGAILGWEDGELSWLGGSVPLPAGTYGPFIYSNVEATLTVPQDVSALINGQQLYMSDNTGKEVSVVVPTDTIASVNTIAPPDEITYRVYRPNINDCRTLNWADGTDEVVTTAGVVPNITGGFNAYFYYFPTKSFANIKEGDPNIIRFSFWYSDTGLSGSWQYDHDDTSSSGGGTAFATKAAKYWIILRDTNSATPWKSGQQMESNKYAIIDSPPGYELSFPTNKDFDKFEVGDVVQTELTNQATITDIDANAVPPTITVDGGSWYALPPVGDGSGDPNGQTYIRKSMSGTGSVLVATGNAIVLRSNNGEWIDNYYVTAPEQRIAARKVSAAAVEKKTN